MDRSLLSNSTQYTPHTSIAPQSRQSAHKHSLVLLALWAVCAEAAFVASLVDVLQPWSILPLMGSMLFLLALWFSLQWDLVRHYVPALPVNTWTTHSVIGFVLGVCVGWTIGVAGAEIAITLSSNVVSYEVSNWLILLAAGAGLVVGFGILGWRQAKALAPYVSAGWWIVTMALAWVLVPLTWLGYEEILGTLVVNIYPEPRGLLAPALTVIAAFGALLIGQEHRVERAWVAGGPADYLSVSADGQVATTPPPNIVWDSNSKLRDSSPVVSKQARAEGGHVLVSSTTGGPGLSLQVFSVPPPADYYAEDVINVVRFSPDGRLLAAGTGQAMEIDSAVNSSNDHAVHVWSVSDGRARYTLSDPLYSVRALAWSPDGRYLAAAGGLEGGHGMFGFGGDNVIRVWRLDAPGDGEGKAPNVVFTLEGHTTTVEALAWSPDGSHLVSRDLSGRVVMWRNP
jgi:hypothetical protein